jgi:hypothetical protein
LLAVAFELFGDAAIAIVLVGEGDAVDGIAQIGVGSGRGFALEKAIIAGA